jgi:hypothetical protein
MVFEERAMELQAARDVGIILLLGLLYAGVLAALKVTRRRPER